MRKRRWLGLLAAGLLGLGIATGGAGPAFAQQQVCGNGGSGYCINAWFGGPPVKMYYGGKSNEDFEFIFNVKECGSGGTTTARPRTNRSSAMSPRVAIQGLRCI